LDLDYGTYPYVTSSNPVAGGVCTGAGVGPTMINEVVGVVKAYTTRVGKGPFPTELFDADGERLRTVGHEFGTTTGRSRRCGWFDAVIVKYAVRINGLTSMALTKLDVMSGFEKIKICVGYKTGDQIISEFPSNIEDLSKCEPVYEEVDGWNEDITGIDKFEDLPENAKAYVKKLEELCGVEASMVAVGPKRKQTIVRSEIY
jgi:adenylosuccinate synthase